MDVTCERCGTEYEFDETLVSGRGTTVKCTNCGHLFKVFRPDAEAGVARTWNVRGADGVVRKLSSLKELQRLITAGTLSEHDEISRGNEPYKRLGDIAELSTFFAAATAAVADTDTDLAGRQRKATSPGMAMAPVPDRAPVSKSPQAAARPPEPPRAPPPARPKDTLVGVGSSKPPSQPPPPARGHRPPTPAPESNPPIPPAPRVPAEAAAPRRAVPAAAAAAAPVPPPPGPPSNRPPARTSERPLYIEADEPVVPVRGRSRSGLWVALVVLVAAAVGVALGWPSIAPMLGLVEEPEVENPAAAHLAPGDAALAQDTIAGYEEAVHHYTQALAFDDHDVDALTRISRAHALWAQALAFDAADLEAAADEDPARQGEANVLRREQRRHAETALARAEDAVRYGSSNAAAEVALSDALRLTGDLERSRSRLNRALTFESDADAETLRVQALVTAAESEGDLARGRDLAEQAVAEDPTLIRARLVYARALLAAGDGAAARAQVDAILRREERHPAGIALRDRIAATGPAEGEEPTPVEGETPPPTEPETPPTEPETPPTEPESGSTRGRRGSSEEPAGDHAPAGREYSWYVRRGDELFERGNLGAAREHYEAARAQRPAGSEALTGLGNVMLQQGDASGAAARFRTAASQGYGEAYVGLGRAYRRMGRNDDAIASFERYLQRMPTGSLASLARRQLEELRASGGGGGGGGGGTGGGSEPTPAPTQEQLPPPRDMQNPPPADVPAIDSEP
ncbi:MAG: zinc-ribbon domain-containing protein [Sandaracinaceae bacterium]|nr:zinc-ribbon domain-containing protein [Sandaracinaceae bacterium]